MPHLPHTPLARCGLRILLVIGLGGFAGAGRVAQAGGPRLLAPGGGPAVTFTEFTVPTAQAGPYGITVGPDGNLWFTEYKFDGNRIGRITPGGAFTESITLRTVGSEPYSIVAGPDGALWFTEFSLFANKIGRITPAGAIREYPIPTGGSQPTAIAAGPDGALWFTESAANHIGRIAPTGTITEFTIPTATSKPSGIAAGLDGNLWFTEYAGNTIGRITPQGGIVEFAVPTASSQPESIVAGPDGALWFTERHAGRIGRITGAGAITEFVIAAGNSYPLSITTGPDGALWFAQLAGIGRLTPAGALTSYPLPPGVGQPTRITAGPDGALWFTEFEANKIGRLTFGATPTPTPCAPPWTDVTGNPFYAYIQSLYCRGIVEGYPDQTFRPYTDADRGTLARWVVRARGWPTDLAGAPHFTDVPAGDPLYPYVETAYHHGVLGGYADHTFRPSNPLTRGQMSKMIVNALGWPLDTRAGQIFRDVDNQNPFWGQIETIYAHGVVSGYECGLNCREFRWGANNTRGQLAKVLANAIGP